MIHFNSQTKKGKFSFLQNAVVKSLLFAVLIFCSSSSSASVTLNVAGSANVPSIQSGSQFIYTVNYSISSLTDVGHGVVADIALPDYLILSDSSNLDNNVSYDPSQVASLAYNSGTRTLHVVFVDPIPAGSTGQFQVKMKYINGVTPNSYDPGITTTIDADNNVNTPAQGGGTGPVTSNTTNVIALAGNVPTVGKALTAGGAIDNTSVYKITVANGGSNGSLILNNPVLRDTLPAGAVFQSATAFAGSNAPTTYSISGGKTVVQWTWPSSLATGYNGSAYVNVQYTSPAFSVGSVIHNNATLDGTVNGLPVGTQIPQTARGTATHTIATPTPGASCYGGGIAAATANWLNHHILAGTSCNWFSNGWYNSGNTELDSVQLHYTVDKAIDMNTIRVGAVYNAIDSPSQAEIKVWYKTNTSGYIALGTYYSMDIYNGTTPVNHTVTLPSGEYITDVKFSIRAYGGSKLPIGGYEDMSYCGNARTAAQGKKDGTPIIEGTTYNPGNVGDDGTVVTNNSDGSYFFDGMSSAYGNCSGRAEILSPRPVFYPPSKWITNGNSFKAGDIVKYQGRFYLGGNQTANGIVIRDTLDSKLIYQSGTSQYYNGSSWVSITPSVTTLGSQTILTYNIGTATPEVDLYIKFDAQVKPGTAPTTISNRFGLSATTPNTLFTGVTDYVDFSVISAVALKVKKGQSGSCGSTGYVYYPEVAHTLPGGNVNYKITVVNQGNVVAKDFIMIDPFPFIGDERGSNYYANMTAPAITSDLLSTVYYTTTHNPCSSDLNPAITPNGCNTPTWSVIPPIDLTTITGIKLTRSANLPVLDSIEISWTMKAPVGVPFGNIMNNSVNYQVSRADNGNQLLPATPNQVGMVADCVNPIGSLGNYVWVDRNKNGLQDEAASDGLNGVKVYLYKDDGTGNFVKIDSTITANDFSGKPGYYLFPMLHTGDYKVQFETSPLDGYYLTSPVNQEPQVDGNSDANTTTGFSGVVHIDENGTGVNKDNMTIDAGYYPIGDLGNYVWYDDNRNGLQDEAAGRGINDVKVYLYKDNGSGTYIKIDSTTTANDASGKPGYYDFIIYTSGNYKVSFPTYIGQTGLTTQNTAAGVDGNSDASPVTGLTNAIVMNIFSHGIPKHNPTIDAGYKPLGSLGNYVWLDDNNNGIQDEPVANGVNGVKVYLYKDNGSGTYVIYDSTITANDSTGKSGWYTFYHLDNGNYKVKFPTMIGNYPISDVTNQAMQVDGDNDANKATGFSGVVTIDVLAGGLNRNNPTIDAGYRTNIGSIGNYVWRDVNSDGIQNEPDSNGINGVKVYLLNGSGVKIDSTVTANNASGKPGYYNFPNLNSGSYQVQFPLVVNGYPLDPVYNQIPQTDGNSDADPITGKSPVVVINTNSSNPLDVNNPTIDAGYGALGTLGNYVWYDDNNDGIQNEPVANGINGVKVILYKETSPGSGVYAKYDSTTTANDTSGRPGYYNFKDLYSANYKVQFPTSVNSFPITGVTNQAPQVDSNNDADRNTGFSGVVAINVTMIGLSRDNPTIDAGYVPIGTIGNYVWYDANKNGLQDEPVANGLNDIKVYLYKETAPGVYTKTDSTITSNDSTGKPGWYTFYNVIKGNYKVQFPTSEGSYYLTPVVNQSAITDGNSDANTATGFSGVIPMAPLLGGINKNNPTIDAGYYCDCSGFKVDIVKNKNYDCVTANTFTFSANINRVGGKYFYSWDFGDGTTSTLANPTHHYATAGEYDVKLTVVENSFCGCRYQASDVQIYVGAKPHAALNYSNNGDCMHFAFNSASTIAMHWISNFEWSFGDGGTSTQSNPTHVYGASGTYNVRLIVTGNYGCKDTAYQSITIPSGCATPTPTPSSSNCKAGYTAPCLNNTYVCADSATKRFNLNTITLTCSKPDSTVLEWHSATPATAGNLISNVSAMPVGTYYAIYRDTVHNCYANNGYGSQNVRVDTCRNYVTSGGGGGVESKTLGDVIAVRLYGNAKAGKTQVDGISNGIKFNSSGVVVNGANDIKLSNLIPSSVANTDAAWVSTPTDLVNFTNAVEVLALDYSKAGITKAVAFGTKTLGDVYSHTKPICDRLKGAELLEVKNITVNGFNLMAYKVRQRTGEVEYAMNLSAGTAANRNNISLQSNWFTDSYVQDEKLYNFQLWAVSYEMVTAMATDIIGKMQNAAAVNAVTNADLPKAYISKGNRTNTNLNVTINNNTSATTGYFELHEKANENAAKSTRQLPFTIAANAATDITIPVKDNYEGDIYVYLNNKLTDLVYLADGTWSLDYDKAKTSITSFNVMNEGNVAVNNNEYRLLRNVTVAGTSKDYITVYKTMMGGGLEQNVSAYKSLLFTANATGASNVTVTLVKKSIVDWKNQYTYTMQLDGNQEYAVNLNQFRSEKYADVINANDIVAVNFSFNNNRNVATAMNISLSKVKFTSAEVAQDNIVNTLNIYPNPVVSSRFITYFKSDAAQSMVLKVIELATGRTVKTQFIKETLKGNNQVEVTLNSEQAKGLYIVTLEADGLKYNPVKVMINK